MTYKLLYSLFCRLRYLKIRGCCNNRRKLSLNLGGSNNAFFFGLVIVRRVDFALFRYRWLLSHNLIANAVSLWLHSSLHDRLLVIFPLLFAIDDKNVVKALACAEVISPWEDSLHWFDLAYFIVNQVCKGNLTFASIGCCCTINHFIFTLTCHDIHQSVILVVKLVHVLVKVRL